MFKTKIIVSTAMMLLFSVCLMAQSSKWQIGIEAGPAISSLRGNDVTKPIQKSRLASFAGLSLQYQLNQRFSLKTGLAHELKGAKYDFIFYDALGQQLGNSTIFFNYQYLTIPLQLKVDIDLGSSLQGFVSAGPYASYLLSATQNFPSNLNNIKEDYNNLDAGLLAGLGVSYPIKSNLRLSAELRNQLGLTNISSAPVQDDGVIKHNAAQLLFGLQYSL